MTEEETIDRKRASADSVLESKKRPRSRLKTLIIGIGVTLIMIGVALTIYMVAYEEEPFLIALTPAFLGVIVIVAALSGKRH